MLMMLTGLSILLITAFKPYSKESIPIKESVRQCISNENLKVSEH